MQDFTADTEHDQNKENLKGERTPRFSQVGWFSAGQWSKREELTWETLTRSGCSLPSITHNIRKYANIKRREAERDPGGTGWDSRSVNHTRFCAHTQLCTRVHGEVKHVMCMCAHTRTPFPNSVYREHRKQEHSGASDAVGEVQMDVMGKSTRKANYRPVVPKQNTWTLNLCLS